MYDAIIVGARCAGAPTAMLLARKGYRILLVDSATFPSDTVSTHIIWPHGAEILDRWGLLDRLGATGCPPIARCLLFDVGPFALKGGVTDTNAGRGGFCPRRRCWTSCSWTRPSRPVRNCEKGLPWRRCCGTTIESPASGGAAERAAPSRNEPDTSSMIARAIRWRCIALASFLHARHRNKQCHRIANFDNAGRAVRTRRRSTKLLMAKWPDPLLQLLPQWVVSPTREPPRASHTDQKDAISQICMPWMMWAVRESTRG
jgi:FAD binding domain